MGKSGRARGSQQLDQSCDRAGALPDKGVGGPVAPCKGGRDRCKPCASKPHEDPNIPLLCNVFCQVLCEGEAFKRDNPDKRFNYSTRARELGEEHIRQGKLPSNFKPENRYLVNFDTKTEQKRINKLKKAGRTAWTPEKIRSRIIRKVAGPAVVRTIRRKARSAWMKLVPGLNVVSTIADIVDLGLMTVEIADEVSKELARFDPGKYDTFEAIPDVAVEGPDGQVTKVYDYKFPGDSMSEDQEDLFSKLSNEASVDRIDDTTCDCGCKRTESAVS